MRPEGGVVELPDLGAGGVKGRVAVRRRRRQRGRTVVRPDLELGSRRYSRIRKYISRGV